MTTKRTFEDAFNLLCGHKLGGGIYRDVFQCALKSDLVVKVEIEQNYGRSFMNVFEHKFWEENCEWKKVADWLAPCEYLSPDGRILLQRKAEPLPTDYELPKKVPAWLTDIKRANMGLLDGRLVCIDYAMTVDKLNVNLKAAHWD